MTRTWPECERLERGSPMRPARGRARRCCPAPSSCCSISLAIVFIGMPLIRGNDMAGRPVRIYVADGVDLSSCRVCGMPEQRVEMEVSSHALAFGCSIWSPLQRRPVAGRAPPRRVLHQPRPPCRKEGCYPSPEEGRASAYIIKLGYCFRDFATRRIRIHIADGGGLARAEALGRPCRTTRRRCAAACGRPAAGDCARSALASCATSSASCSTSSFWGLVAGSAERLAGSFVNCFADGVADRGADSFVSSFADRFVDSSAEGHADRFVAGLVDGFADSFAICFANGRSDHSADDFDNGPANSFADSAADMAPIASSTASPTPSSTGPPRVSLATSPRAAPTAPPTASSTASPRTTLRA